MRIRIVPYACRYRIVASETVSGTVLYIFIRFCHVLYERTVSHYVCVSGRFCTITDTCGKILYRNRVGGRTVSESASTVLYRTVTIRCTVSDTSTSTVVVSDLPNVTDLPKVAGCGTGMDIEMDKEMDNEP